MHSDLGNVIHYDMSPIQGSVALCERVTKRPAIIGDQGMLLRSKVKIWVTCKECLEWMHS